jgi:hypothetical protein
MRLVVRVLTAGVAVACAALPLLLLEGSAVQAATPRALSAPAQVSASNWSTMPTTATPNANSTDTGISCVTSVFCLAIGNFQYGTTGATTGEMWNGRTWSALTMPTVANTSEPVLADLSCVTTSFCVAVGYAYYSSGSTYTSLIEQWNGTAWSVVQGTVAPTSDNYLEGVSCLSVSFCMAVAATDTAPYVEQWNGSTWTPTTLSIPAGFTDAYFDSVSCTTPSLCMAVGAGALPSSDDTPFAEQWTASSWTVTSVPAVTSPNYGLASVSCAGPSFCAAVGGNENVNVVNIWNGSSWTLASVPTPAGGATLRGISCFSATSCTTVGYTGDYTGSEAITWDGQTWAQATTAAAPPSSDANLYLAVDCLTDWACVAAGYAQFGSGGGTTYLPLEAMAPIARSGYRFVASDGGIFNYGAGAPFLGSMGGQHLNAPIVGMATMPAGDGYYLVAADGGVFNYGSAQFYGSAGSLHLNKPIVGMAVTPDGGGYWLVASDGGIFSYGDAQFYGSMGGQPLNKPIVGIASLPNGYGYYLVASDGGIFTFPTGPQGPPFLGSTGSIPLNKPVVGMAVTSAGQYYLVASDGGIFSFPTGPSGPPFYGSTGSIVLNKPVIGMTMTAGGAGYYLGASDGGIFSFPTGPSGPPFYGSRGGQPLNAPIVGISG